MGRVGQLDFWGERVGRGVGEGGVLEEFWGDDFAGAAPDCEAVDYHRAGLFFGVEVVLHAVGEGC